MMHKGSILSLTRLACVLTLASVQCGSDEPARFQAPPGGDALSQPETLGVAPQDAALQWNALRLFHRPEQFTAWERHGVSLRGEPGESVALRLAPSRVPLPCPPEAIDGGAAQFEPVSGLCRGTDPQVAGLPPNVSYYIGGPFYFGRMISPPIATAAPIDRLIPSWLTDTPPGTWVQAHVRVQIDGTWSRWYPLPIWASDENTLKRHSVNTPADGIATVDTDTFMLRGGRTTRTLQLSVTLSATSPALSPTVRMIGAVVSKDSKTYPTKAPDPTVWGQSLEVPQRSQGLPEYKDKGYGGGGAVWCSPTCTSMVMKYWSQQSASQSLSRPVPQVAAGCFDWVYSGTGNWPFNTAYAGEAGLFGFVTRLYSMADAEPWIQAGVPLIISIAYKEGALPGSPITKTNGHLIVIRGFDKSGNVITNDPAARGNEQVQITYPRAALEAAWSNSHRTAYVIYPPTWARGRTLPPH